MTNWRVSCSCYSHLNTLDLILSCRLEYLLRLTVTSLTFILAATVPYLDLFISLLGALVMATLELIFPVMVDTAVSWPDITWTSRLKVT